MKFGKIDHPEAYGDFSLPITHEIFDLLPERDGDLKVTVGGTQWSSIKWGEQWMPKGVKSDQRLMHYSRMFNNVELNATHYRIFPRETMEKWAEQVEGDFVFIPKFPQSISHFSRFVNCEERTQLFIESLDALGDKCGPAFIQLPSNYHAGNLEALLTYLENLPRHHRYCVEFRHESWFEDTEIWNTVVAQLYAWNIGLVISDTLGRRDALHMAITTPFVIVRYGGYGLHPSDTVRLENWVQWLSSHSKVREFHFCIHQPDSILTPETAQLFWQLMDKYQLPHSFAGPRSLTLF